MIITSMLPSREHYQLIERSPSDRLLFSDRKSDRFEISIPAGSPWDFAWEISIQENHNKSDGGRYLSRVRLKCHRPRPEPTHTIDREVIKAIVVSGYDSQFFYAAPLGDRLWLVYSCRT